MHTSYLDNYFDFWPHPGEGASFEIWSWGEKESHRVELEKEELDALLVSILKGYSKEDIETLLEKARETNE